MIHDTEFENKGSSIMKEVDMLDEKKTRGDSMPSPPKFNTNE